MLEEHLEWADTSYDHTSEGTVNIDSTDECFSV